MDAAQYDQEYRSGRPPWDIGVPQPALTRVLDAGLVKGPAVLDAGCGSGTLSLELARRGFEVTGVDVSRVAIEQARAKAAAAGLSVRFEVRDATRELGAGPFDSIFDCGLLHSVHRLGAGEARKYLALLPGLAAPGATVFVVAVSVASGQSFGLTEDYLRRAFGEPLWTGTGIAEIDISAVVDGCDFTHRGFLARAIRRGYR
ncbi:class I SAM-dependent methyltransferase [Actinoplanes sp. TBRC 11911]|uniref:class I SAM-dependent methyltransferase n=1 Tax=Actinoplanes sp. TBRC 11911 TaxID=2729386 RepID=UPI00145D3100|nr:class I SAM-dependent methyltransferase [Actinoplanes sp. TBRC 11911]NMO52732.1 class I SAM-dependent methyltransferase [Actinoplanes sp. TBRC 11911]